jgi:hypothetical protein
MVNGRRMCSPQVAPSAGTLDETERVASELGVDRQTALLLLLVSKLDQLREAVIAPPRVAQDAKEVLVIVATVINSGTPVQGPRVRVSRGYPTVIRQRRHTGTTRTGYVAFERSDTANPLSRMAFRDNDSISVPLEGLDSLWFDADNNDTSFEIIVAYGQRRQVD